MVYAEGAQTLVKVVQNLSSARSLEEIMRLVRSAAREIAQADGATFVLKDGPYCFYADEDAIEPLWKGQRFPLTACVSGWAMDNKQAVVIPDIYQDDRVPINAYRPTFVKSLAMTPIRLSDPIGAIGTYWKDHVLPSHQQLELLQALADTTSVAMENLNLYRSLEERIEELKKANMAKTEFLTTLSHELRTPMNAIVGWSEMLKEPDIDDEDKLKGAETIYRNAINQTHVIDDLLDISQMVSGKFQMQQKPASLLQAINEAIELIRPEAIAKSINIQFSNDAGDAFLLGDPTRLRQLVLYLLKNAVKFSANYQDVELALTTSGPHFKLDISDHGIGIAAELQPRIFEIFHQGDGSMKRKHGGLGLGLSIVQHLAQAHRGSVEVQSAGENKGSTFTVMLPSLNVDRTKNHPLQNQPNDLFM